MLVYLEIVYNSLRNDILKSLKGSLFLFIAAIIWGSGFVAQTMAASDIPAFSFNAYRSFTAVIFLGLLILFTVVFGKNKGKKLNKVFTKTEVLGGGLCGVFLFFASFCQQQGITLYPEDAAASGRSGFITATYVVMVAVYSLIRERKMQIPVLIAVIGCTVGMYFLCLSGGIDKIYVGDIFVFLCAIFFTVHLIVIDRFPGTDSIRMSFMQFLVCGLLSFISTFIFEGNPAVITSDTIGSILYMGIMSSGIAYTLQFAGQKYASPTVCSIVMSLESVFAVLFGWLILSERLSVKEGFGCVLVFASVILSQVPSFKTKKSIE